jgi:response regulator NasT
VLDRAKGKLQAEGGLTEPEAFRWIQKTSMDRRVPMRAVAEELLAGSLPAERAAGGKEAAGTDGSASG